MKVSLWLAAVARWILVAVEAEQYPHQQGGGYMGQIKQQACRSAAEYSGSHYPQDEGRTGVVAEGQQPLGLGAGALSVLV